MNIEFTEKQKYTHPAIWIPLIMISLIPVYGIYQQIINKEVFGDKPISDTQLILLALFTFLFLLFFWYISLETKIDRNGISIHFKPFLKKYIRWSDVKSAEIIKYGFVGYGIRLGSKYGTVYNIKGNKGLALELNDGKKVLIGTQKENELNAIQKQMISANKR